MNDIAIALAKLAGARAGIRSVIDDADERTRGSRRYDNFLAVDVAPFFETSERNVQILQELMPQLFAELPSVRIDPETEMAAPHAANYSRSQMEALVRLIDNAFEIRAHSELATPEATASDPLIFISHGRASDWREVQSYIERDIGFATLELAQEPNLGRTVLQKLEQESNRCSSAVIVMTGDDIDAAGNARARENVLHEIGYFQAKFGLAGVCLLHEDGTNITSNIHGLVYIPFPKGRIEATLGSLARELNSFYRQ